MKKKRKKEGKDKEEENNNDMRGIKRGERERRDKAGTI